MKLGGIKDNMLSAIFEKNELILESLGLITNSITMYFIIRVEIIVFLLILDIVMVLIYKLNNNFYFWLRYKLVNRPYRMVRVYRFSRDISYWISKRRPWYIHLVGKDKKELSDVLYTDTALLRLIRLILYLISPFTIGTYIAVLISLYYYNPLLFNIDFVEIMSYVSNLNINVLATFLSSVLVLVLFFLSWQYSSLRGRIRRGASRAGQSALEESMQYHRRLSSNLTRLVSSGSKKFEYLIENRDYLEHIKLYSLSKFIEDVDNGQVSWFEKNLSYINRDDFTNMSFPDLENDEIVCSIIKQIVDDGYDEIMSWMGFYGSRTRAIHNIIRDRDRDFSDIRMQSISKESISKLMGFEKKHYILEDIQNEPPEKDKQYLYEEYILKQFKDFSDSFDYRIIRNLELLADLSDYDRQLSRLLHFNSNRFGRILSFWLGRE
jgi:hypothetical protein